MTNVVRLRDRALESRDAIELVSNKWRIAILHLLASGPLRAGALQRGLDEVSPKVLTQTLRGMERDGLVERTVSPFGPLRVEYRLSEMGTSALAPLRELCHWARANTQTRDAARRKFDTQEKAGARRASQQIGR
jgi:DNA-binding HxlR family transcriptional regulator